ncbi:hypothetical protein Q7M84_02675 [Candidatus Liberibacter asiaticus]|uniref:hypothetical protein n=1 Tax=Liberibacter asiaticus TaxID=34021 RepID=UPI000ABA2AB4|nr:hypothetical protein [Candidatus Liberibacter asiaticus]
MKQLKATVGDVGNRNTNNPVVYLEKCVAYFLFFLRRSVPRCLKGFSPLSRLFLS